MGVEVGTEVKVKTHQLILAVLPNAFLLNKCMTCGIHFCSMFLLRFDTVYQAMSVWIL